MKKFTLHDILTIALCCLVLGIAGGYGWRMYHDNLKPPQPASIYLADLSLEISKGSEFWLPTSDTEMLHFLPLRGACYEMAVRRELRK